MTHRQRYIVVGNSAAGLAALETLRRNDQFCSITLISREEGPAYSLVLLPHFIGGKIDEHRLLITDSEYYRRLNAKCLFGKEVVEIRPERQEVVLHDASKVSYDKLIICSGAKPNPVDLDRNGAIKIKCLRTIQDAIEIKRLLQNAKKLVFVGAGLINLKLISLIKSQDLEIHVVELGKRILPNLLDEEAAAIVEKRMKESHIYLHKDTFLKGIASGKHGKSFAHLADDRRLEAEAIIVNTGISPNFVFADACGLKVNRGIIINDYGETNIPNIYAAGDVVEARERISGEYTNIGNWLNAIEQGKTAALASIGLHRKYIGSLNANIADLFGLTVASMGNVGMIAEDCESLQFSDVMRNQYRRIVIRQGKFIAGVFINEMRYAGSFVPRLGESINDRVQSTLKDYGAYTSFPRMLRYSGI